MALQNLHPRFKSGRRLQPSRVMQAKVARRSLGEGGPRRSTRYGWQAKIH